MSASERFGGGGFCAAENNKADTTPAPNTTKAVHRKIIAAPTLTYCCPTFPKVDENVSACKCMDRAERPFHRPNSRAVCGHLAPPRPHAWSRQKSDGVLGRSGPC